MGFADAEIAERLKLTVAAVRQRRSQPPTSPRTQTDHPTPAGLTPALAALKDARKAGGKAEAAFQRGLAALTPWVEKEAQRPVPRSTVV